MLDDIPFNSRSEGTLTPLADGRFLYETSGNGEPDTAAVWAFDPTTSTSTPLAIGLKNSYAHIQLDDGRILVTDVGDSATNPPVEELNVIASPSTEPVNFGRPECPGDTE